MTKPGCSVPDCVRPKHANGMCNSHYKRWKRNGTPDGLTVDKRFQRHISHVNEHGCWVWDKPSAKGYGQFFGLAHRWAYKRFIGAIPDDLPLDHLCRNRACVNPNHLEPVTLGENVLRGEGLAAVNARKTHCIRLHEFTAANTYLTPNGRRMCRSCMAIRERKRNQSNPEGSLTN